MNETERYTAYTRPFKVKCDKLKAENERLRAALQKAVEDQQVVEAEYTVGHDPILWPRPWEEEAKQALKESR